MYDHQLHFVRRLMWRHVIFALRPFLGWQWVVSDRRNRAMRLSMPNTKYVCVSLAAISLVLEKMSRAQINSVYLDVPNAFDASFNANTKCMRRAKSNVK